MSYQNGTQPIETLVTDIVDLPQTESPNPELDQAFLSTWTNYKRTRAWTRKTFMACLQDFEGIEATEAEADRLIEAFDIELDEPEAPPPKSIQDVSEASIADVKDALDAEEAFQRKEQAGNALHSGYITQVAIDKLKETKSMSATWVYIRLSMNINLQTGVTHKISRAELAKKEGISQRTWYRIEKQMREAGLIAYHEEDVAHAWKQPVSFILPDVKDWYNNVELALKSNGNR